MPEFSVDIPHTLSQEEARARLDRARSKLETEYGLDCRWEGERLRVARKGLDGWVRIEPERLVVDVKLGLVLGALSSTIRQGISDKLTRLMAE